jgi:uncharacterized protein (TIGR00251 family)
MLKSDPGLDILDEYRQILEAKGELTISLRVQPGSRKSKIVGVMADGKLKVAVAAPPADNRANEALIKFLAELFSVKNSQVSIKNGLSSRSKLIKISV